MTEQIILLVISSLILVAQIATPVYFRRKYLKTKRKQDEEMMELNQMLADLHRRQREINSVASRKLKK